MKTFYKLAMASAAAALLAGTAQAQTDLTLVATTGDIVPGTALSTTAALGDQVGTFNFTVTSAGNFTTTNNLDARVTIALSNAAFLSDPTLTGPAMTGCVEGGASIVSGGAGASTVTFLVPDVDNCNVVPMTVQTTIGLSSLAAANFTVVVARVDGIALSKTATFDADGGTAGVQPLVSVAAPWIVTFSATNAGDSELDLGLSPAFSAFKGGMSPVFDAKIGEFNIAPGGTRLTLQDSGVLDGVDDVGDPENLSLAIVAGDAAGIDRFEIGALAALTRSGTSNTFTIADFNPAAPAGPYDVTVFLSGAATTPAPASVAAQSVIPSATVTEGSGTSAVNFASTGGLASLTREGTTLTFDWVPLEPALQINQFRFTGLKGTPVPRVLVSVFDLNTGETNVNTFDLTGDLNITAGGEALLQGPQLGQILAAAGELDLGINPPSAAVTRGTVSFTIEGNAVGVRRFVQAAGGTGFSFTSAVDEK